MRGYLWNNKTYWVIILKKKIMFVIVFVKIWFFAAIFNVLQRYFKMLNADKS